MGNLHRLGNVYSYNLDFTTPDLADLDLRLSGFSSLILELAMTRVPVSGNFGTEFVDLRLGGLSSLV